MNDEGAGNRNCMKSEMAQKSEIRNRIIVPKIGYNFLKIWWAMDGSFKQ